MTIHLFFKFAVAFFKFTKKDEYTIININIPMHPCHDPQMSIINQLVNSLQIAQQRNPPVFNPDPQVAELNQLKCQLQSIQTDVDRLKEDVLILLKCDQAKPVIQQQVSTVPIPTHSGLVAPPIAPNNPVLLDDNPLLPEELPEFFSEEDDSEEEFRSIQPTDQLANMQLRRRKSRVASSNQPVANEPLELVSMLYPGANPPSQPYLWIVFLTIVDPTRKHSTPPKSVASVTYELPAYTPSIINKTESPFIIYRQTNELPIQLTAKIKFQPELKKPDITVKHTISNHAVVLTDIQTNKVTHIKKYDPGFGAYELFEVKSDLRMG